MMEYVEFKNKIADSIKDYLPAEYKDFELRFCTVTKSDFEYEALMIEESGKPGAVPALNITEAYKKYIDGSELEDILDELADIRMNAHLSASINPHDILDLGKIKNFIIPRLINIENHDKYLSDKPFTPVEDFAVIYAVRFERMESCSDAIITTSLLEFWGIDSEELHKIAMKNLTKKSPYFCNMMSFISGDRCSLNVDLLDPADYEFPMFILSNSAQMYGASMILNSGLMKKLVDRLGDIYIIPSSVHEVLIIPKFVVTSAVGLQDTVKLINSSELSSEDILSNHVYEYYGETESIAMVI